MAIPKIEKQVWYPHWKAEFARWASQYGYSVHEVIADGEWHPIADGVRYRVWFDIVQPGGELSNSNIKKTWRPSLRLPDGTIDVEQVAVVRSIRETPEWRLARDSQCPRYVQGLRLKGAHSIVQAEIVAVSIPELKPASAAWAQPTSLDVSMKILGGESAGAVAGALINVNVPLRLDCDKNFVSVPPALGRLQSGGTVALNLKKVNADTVELVAIMEGCALAEMT